MILLTQLYLFIKACIERNDVSGAHYSKITMEDDHGIISVTIHYKDDKGLDATSDTFVLSLAFGENLQDGFTKYQTDKVNMVCKTVQSHENHRSNIYRFAEYVFVREQVECFKEIDRIIKKTISLLSSVYDYQAAAIANEKGTK